MDALAELAGHVDEVRVEAGEPLWRLGAPADGFHLICAGDVHLGGGPWRVGDHLGPGSVPGIVGTLAGRSYEYEAIASEPSLLLHVGAEPFLDLLEDHFEMAYELLGRLARNVLEAETGGVDLGSGRSDLP